MPGFNPRIPPQLLQGATPPVDPRASAMDPRVQAAREQMMGRMDNSAAPPMLPLGAGGPAPMEGTGVRPPGGQMAEPGAMDGGPNVQGRQMLARLLAMGSRGAR